jgi:hypothetical protein
VHGGCRNQQHDGVLLITCLKGDTVLKAQGTAVALGEMLGLQGGLLLRHSAATALPHVRCVCSASFLTEAFWAGS